MVVPDAVCASAVSRHPFPTQSPPNERWSNSPLGKCKTKLRLRQLLVATRPASSGAGRGRSRWLLPAASPPAFWESDLAHTLARSAPADPLHGNKTGVSAHTPGLLVAVVLWGEGQGRTGWKPGKCPSTRTAESMTALPALSTVTQPWREWSRTNLQRTPGSCRKVRVTRLYKNERRETDRRRTLLSTIHEPART